MFDIAHFEFSHVVVRLVLVLHCVDVVLHLLDEGLVEAEAEVVVLGHQGFEDEPEGVLHAVQEADVLMGFEFGVVGQDDNGEYQHVVGHDVGELAGNFGTLKL